MYIWYIYLEGSIHLRFINIYLNIYNQKSNENGNFEEGFCLIKKKNFLLRKLKVVRKDSNKISTTNLIFL